MLDWFAQISNWEGTAAELADRARDLMRLLGLPDDPVSPNERLVRHYVQLGILRRPERSGKEAFFGSRQILEFLAARILLQDGWPLAKIAEMASRASLEELRALIPDRSRMNKAQALIERFKLAPSEACDGIGSPMYCRSLATTQRKLSLQESLRALGNRSPRPIRQEIVRLELAPWCTVYVDVEELRRLPPETPELLGHALAEILQEERDRIRR